MLNVSVLLLAVAVCFESLLIMDLSNRVRRIQNAAAAVLREDQ